MSEAGEIAAYATVGPRRSYSLAHRVRRRANLALMRLHEASLDAALDIRAYAPMAKGLDAAAQAAPYEPISYWALDRISRALRLGPEDVLYDIGCGMGRVNCYFARQRIARSIGVELDANLAAVAQTNAMKLRGRRAPIAIYAGDAADHSYVDGTVFFMFNPFGAEVMQRVLAKVDQDRAGRSIRIVYANPVHSDVLDATPWLQRSGSLIPVLQFGIQTHTQVWASD